MSLISRARWIVPALAAAMITIILIPSGVWKAPAVDAVYHGFNANLIYANNGGGTISISNDAIEINASRNSQPSVNLATTPLQRLRASVEVRLLDDGSSSMPFRVGLWSPWIDAGSFVVFESAPERLITVVTIAKGTPAATLVGGDILTRTVLGEYEPDHLYQISIDLDKRTGKLAESVATQGGMTYPRISVNSAQFPVLFSNVPLSLSASASGEADTTQVFLSKYSLSLPHQTWFASKAADPLASGMLVLLAVLGILALTVAIGRGMSSAACSTAAKLRALWHRLRASFPRLNPVFLLVVVALLIYLVGNVVLFPLGGHPFDMTNEKLYAYVARAYGPTQLYYLPNVVSVPSIWGGIPYQESSFPYEPAAAYLSAGVAWVTSLGFAGGGAFSANSVPLEYVIKATNVLFGLADSVFIFLILRLTKLSSAKSLLGSGLFLFNPAVWFSMSIWGQTHVISLLFLLAAIYFAEKHAPIWAWLTLGLGCLTRPQMVVFGLLLGIVLVRKFAAMETIVAFSWATIVVFLTLLPFTLATSPSLPVDVMIHDFRVQEGGGNVVALTTVSQDAYSVWPLVTHLATGASGLARVFTPSATPLLGRFTYQSSSQLLVVLALMLIGATLVFRRLGTLDSGAYLPTLALGISSLLMLLTGIVATHFLLALPLLLLCRRWMGPVAYAFVALVWTTTTFVPMFGDMGLVISPHDYPILAPSNNSITRFFVELYSSDRFMTVGIVANICVLIVVAVPALRLSKATKLAAQAISLY